MEQTPKPGSKKIYLILFLLVALLVIFFALGKKEITMEIPQEPADAQMIEIQTQGTTDEVAAIEMDLNNTNVDSLDQ